MPSEACEGERAHEPELGLDVARRMEKMELSLDILGNNDLFLEEAFRASNLPRNDVERLAETGGILSTLSRIRERAQVLRKKIKALALLGMLFSAGEIGAQTMGGGREYSGTDSGESAISRISERGQGGFSGNYKTVLEGDFRALAKNAEHEWLIVLAKKPEANTRLLAYVQGNTASIDIDTEKLVDLVVKEGYTEAIDQFISVHNHSFSAWEELMTSDEYESWRGAMRLETKTKDDVRSYTQNAKEGKLPPLILPPSAPDIFDFFGNVISKEGYDAEVKGAVVDPSGVWEFSLDPKISKESPGSGLYYVMRKKSKGEIVSPEIEKKYELALDEYRKAHARVVSPYSEKAVSRALSGDVSLIMKEKGSKEKFIKKLERAAQMLDITLTFSPYQDPETGQGTDK